MNSSLKQNEQLNKRLDRLLDELIWLYPDIAITEARTIIEDAAKMLLSDLSIEFDKKDELPQLRKKLNEKLGLRAKEQNKESEIGAITAKMLGNFEAVALSLDQLRNQFSNAHGRGYNDIDVPVRYAKLAYNSARAIIEFWFATFDDLEGVTDES